MVMNTVLLYVCLYLQLGAETGTTVIFKPSKHVITHMLVMSIHWTNKDKNDLCKDIGLSVCFVLNCITVPVIE